MHKRTFGILTAALLAALTVAAGAIASGRSADSMTAGPALTVHQTKYGKVLFDGHDRALYSFGPDKRGSSSCYRSCAKAWPPYTVTGKPRAEAGVKGSLIGTTRRKDGKLQATYNGHPLYRYSADPKGKAGCQGVNNSGGIWLVVAPTGKPVK
jgi:predicted lipoprotein with Yx(FWY)xxD motif